MKRIVINHVMLCYVMSNLTTNHTYHSLTFFNVTIHHRNDFSHKERRQRIFTLFFILINLEIILLLHQSALCGKPFIANTHLQLRFCQYGIWTTTSKEMTSDEFVNGIYLGRVCSWTCRLGDNRIGMINDTNIRRW